MLTKAIVRPPAPNFGDGLTTVATELGPPQFQLALAQHLSYCKALERCGLNLTRLDPDLGYPDSTFVEDTAILTARCAVITRPGAASRLGEAENMRAVITRFYPSPFSIHEPGTLDGGDICQAGDHFFLGLSERTNEAGAQQLSAVLALFGYSSSFVDVRGIDGLLHLKSGLAYLGANRLLMVEALEGVVLEASISDYEIIRVPTDEQYAANCLRVNDYVLLAAGYPRVAETLAGLGYQTMALEMSEFQKMDGGLSCLSLRF
jgi:dimethylargininase